MPRLHLAVTLATAAVLVGGCTTQQTSSSASGFEGEEADVAAVIDDIASAGQKGDADEICSKYFSKKLADSLKAGNADCQDEVQEAIQDVNDFDLEVTDVTVTGTTATAAVQAGDEDPSKATFELAREGTSWRVTSLGGS